MTSPELSTPEMAAAALSCEAFADAVKLAAWLGPGRGLTASGVLRPAIAVQACQPLGIPLASSGRLPGLRAAARDIAVRYPRPRHHRRLAWR